MIELRVLPDPMVYPSCEWCGGGEDLGMLMINHIMCARCYESRFPQSGRGWGIG